MTNLPVISVLKRRDFLLGCVAGTCAGTVGVPAIASGGGPGNEDKKGKGKGMTKTDPPELKSDTGYSTAKLLRTSKSTARSIAQSGSVPNVQGFGQSMATHLFTMIAIDPKRAKALVSEMDGLSGRNARRARLNQEVAATQTLMAKAQPGSAKAKNLKTFLACTKFWASRPNEGTL